jgi:hypothetical protein
MRDLYFERNEHLLKKANEMLSKVFIYSGAYDVSEFNRKRCLNEIGAFIDSVSKKKEINLVKKEDIKIVEVLKKKNIKVSPTIIISPERKIKKYKPINELFEEYKTHNGLTDADFGIGLKNPRTREYVFNKAMFSRFAFSCGYSQVALGKFLKLDRTTIIYYINEYKDRNYGYEESDTKVIG